MEILVTLTSLGIFRTVGIKVTVSLFRQQKKIRRRKEIESKRRANYCKRSRQLLKRMMSDVLMQKEIPRKTLTVL
jgi:hypothetical protein